ncbi:MAG TPA: RNA-binding protein [Mucilaginibacter sp.]|jgi:RNA recognition motif-containing protein|nr:RNA-binding protein [Mucilaginibacter sp.]
MITLFVGGFPLDMDEIELVKLVMPFGQVNTIKIVKDKKTRKSKGYAFLEMFDLEAAQNVVDNLNGAPVGDRVLNINISVEKPKPAARPWSPKPQFAPKSNYVKAERPSDPSAPFKKKRPRRSMD